MGQKEKRFKSNIDNHIKYKVSKHPQKADIVRLDTQARLNYVYAVNKKTT